MEGLSGVEITLVRPAVHSFEVFLSVFIVLVGRVSVGLNISALLFMMLCGVLFIWKIVLGGGLGILSLGYCEQLNCMLVSIGCSFIRCLIVDCAASFQHLSH